MGVATTHRHEYQAEYFMPSKKEVRRLGLVLYWSGYILPRESWSPKRCWSTSMKADPNFKYEKLIVMCRDRFVKEYSQEKLEKDYAGKGFRDIIRQSNKKVSTVTGIFFK